MNKLSIENVDVKDKRVVIRVDFNVPQARVGRALRNSARLAASPRPAPRCPALCVVFV